MKQEKFGKHILRDEFRKLLDSLDVKADLFDSDSAFKLLDHDKDGLISAEDLAQVFTGSDSISNSRVYTSKTLEKEPNNQKGYPLPADLMKALTFYLKELVSVGRIIRNLRSLLLSHSSFFNLPLLTEPDIRLKLASVASTVGRHLDSSILVFISKHIR